MFEKLTNRFCAFLQVFLVCVFLSSCQEPVSSTSPGDHTYPNTATSPPSTANAPTVQTWQDIYAEFLREKIPTGEIDIDSLAEGSEEKARLGAFMSGGYPIVPFFYIHDIDKNGIPELVFIDPTYDYCGDVYTYKNNSVIKLGSIEFYPFGSVGIPLDRPDGLYSDIGYKGQYGSIIFYSIKDGVLKNQFVLEYNNEPESSDHEGDAYDYRNFGHLDYYEVTETNISKVILNRNQETP